VGRWALSLKFLIRGLLKYCAVVLTNLHNFFANKMFLFFFVFVQFAIIYRVYCESVALARRTNNRKVVGSRPTKVVCITVMTGNRLR